MPPAPSVRAIALLAGVVVLAGCGGDETRSIEIGPGAPVTTPPRIAPPGISAAERLGVIPDPEEAPPPTALDWTAPGEWKELPAAPMREVGFAVAGAPDAECTLAVYPGGAGGVLANVNRWRGQLGLEPIEEAALARLPTRPLLGGAAAFVELEGRYVGMNGSKDVPGAKLRGLVRVLPGATVFVKLVGPAAIVDGEAERFAAFCASIRARGATSSPHAPAPEAPPAAPPPSVAPPVAGSAGEARDIRWTWPAGWAPATSDRPMRVASFRVEGAPSVDVALTVLGGSAGGLEANLNRWRDQMGKPPLSSEEIAALPRVDALGTKAVLVAIDGTLSSSKGMPGAGEPVPDATFLGAVVERASDVVFVKATGPAVEVAKMKASFDAFVGSLRDAGGAR